MPKRTSACGRLICNFASGKAAVVLLGRGHHLVRRLIAARPACDAKRNRSALVIASPDRQRATGPNLFQPTSADQFIHNLSGGLASNVRRQFNAAIVALRSHRQNDALAIGKSCHRDLRSLVQRHALPPPKPHLGHAAGGAGSRSAPGARNGHSTAPFADECQSFLDNVIAGLGQIGAWSNPTADPAILFDKFHVMRHLGAALDQVRKNEYARLQGRGRRYIKGQKYTLLSRKENLTLEGKKRLNTAYLLKNPSASCGATSARAGRGASSRTGAPASSGSGSRPTRSSPR